MKVSAYYFWTFIGIIAVFLFSTIPLYISLRDTRKLLHAVLQRNSENSSVAYTDILDYSVIIKNADLSVSLTVIGFAALLVGALVEYKHVHMLGNMILPKRKYGNFEYIVIIAFFVISYTIFKFL